MLFRSLLLLLLLLQVLCLHLQLALLYRSWRPLLLSAPLLDRTKVRPRLLHCKYCSTSLMKVVRNIATTLLPSSLLSSISSLPAPIFPINTNTTPTSALPATATTTLSAVLLVVGSDFAF